MGYIEFEDCKVCLSSLKKGMHTDIKIPNIPLHDEILQEVFYFLKTDKYVKRISFRNIGFGPKLAIVLAEILEQNQAITECDLSGNPIGSEGAMCLSAALRKTNNTLTCLDLCNCKLGSDGANYWSRMLEEESNNSLKTLRLANNQIDDEGATAFARTFRRSKRMGLQIDLRNNQISDIGLNELANAIKQNNTLCALRLQGNVKKGCSVLHYIDHCIRRNQKLVVQQEVQHNITKIQNCDCYLESCILHNCDLDIPSTIQLSAGLSRNKRLRKLSLKNNSLTNEGIIMIAKALEWNNRTLISIYIEDNNMEQSGMEAFAKVFEKNSVLKKFQVMNSLVINLSNGLQPFLPRVAGRLSNGFIHMENSLQVLHLCNMGLNDTTASILISGIAWYSHLKDIDLRNNSFGDHVQYCLARLLHRNYLLEKLDISNNNMTLNGLLPLMEEVKDHPSIIYLVLGRYPIFEEVIYEICNYAKMSKTLCHLFLYVKVKHARLTTCISEVEDTCFIRNRNEYKKIIAIQNLEEEKENRLFLKNFWTRKVASNFYLNYLIKAVRSRITEMVLMHQQDMLLQTKKKI